jgi:hypothetical protein
MSGTPVPDSPFWHRLLLTTIVVILFTGLVAPATPRWWEPAPPRERLRGIVAAPGGDAYVVWSEQNGQSWLTRYGAIGAWWSRPLPPTSDSICARCLSSGDDGAIVRYSGVGGTWVTRYSATGEQMWSTLLTLDSERGFGPTVWLAHTILVPVQYSWYIELDRATGAFVRTIERPYAQQVVNGMLVEHRESHSLWTDIEDGTITRLDPKGAVSAYATRTGTYGGSTVHYVSVQEHANRVVVHDDGVPIHDVKLPGRITTGSMERSMYREQDPWAAPLTRFVPVTTYKSGKSQLHVVDLERGLVARSIECDCFISWRRGNSWIAFGGDQLVGLDGTDGTIRRLRTSTQFYDHDVARAGYIWIADAIDGRLAVERVDFTSLRPHFGTGFTARAPTRE